MSKLILIHKDAGQQWSAEMECEAIKLDDLTWEWLQHAFIAVGFSVLQVEEFFMKEESEKI